MAINNDKPDRWAEDIHQSVEKYNAWYLDFAPAAFRSARKRAFEMARDAFEKTDYMRNISVEVLRMNPEVLPVLRMSTCPPIARDRLAALSAASKTLISKMEKLECPGFPSRMAKSELESSLEKIADTINSMLDRELFAWLSSPVPGEPAEWEVERAMDIVSDRLVRNDCRFDDMK